MLPEPASVIVESTPPVKLGHMLVSIAYRTRRPMGSEPASLRFLCPGQGQDNVAEYGTVSPT